MGSLPYFLNEVDATISKLHKVPLLDVALQATLTRWRGSHWNHIREWWEIKTTMRVRFGYSKDYQQNFIKYWGSSNTRKHLQYCKAKWIREGLPKNLWMHNFIYTLGTFPKAWYINIRMENGIYPWYLSTHGIHPPMEFTHGIVSSIHPWYCK